MSSPQNDNKTRTSFLVQKCQHPLLFLVYFSQVGFVFFILFTIFCRFLKSHCIHFCLFLKEHGNMNFTIKPVYRIACLHSGNLKFVNEKSFKSKLMSFLLTTIADDFFINILRHLHVVHPRSMYISVQTCEEWKLYILHE